MRVNLHPKNMVCFDPNAEVWRKVRRGKNFGLKRVLLCVGTLFLAGCAMAQEGWLKQAAAQRLTPTSDRVAPVAVVRTEGRVESADNLLLEDSKSCRLIFEKNGRKPFVVLDFGKQSVGGYAVFRVTAKSGMPVVRLAYACHPNGLSETGDFTRETSARYLGPSIDLPVLPANINRHECYTIPRTGSFIAPLIQGQARYIRVQLDTSDTSVDIDSVVMVNSEVFDRSTQDGAFLCSDERLNRLWAISAWTLQIASFPNGNAWKTVDGWLLPRKLEQAEEVGLSVQGEAWEDVKIETRFELRTNPHFVSAAGIAFRAKDVRNAYLAEVALDGSFKLIRRLAGLDTVISEKKLASPLTDGQQYTLEIALRGPIITTYLDHAVIDETRDSAFTAGRVGFWSQKEKWPLYDYIRVADSAGKMLLSDDFDKGLAQWSFPRTLSYVSDGGKRDRLVWSGDLYWAERNAFYAFAKPTYLRDSLKMLAFNQTPEGYVQASPYPGRSVPPGTGEYGPFPSDEFAAWIVPVAWDYLLYTDDVETLRDIYPPITRLLGYLRTHMGTNSLFEQRAETSKHANNLNLGDVRSRTYMNILLWKTFSDASRITERLQRMEEAAALQHEADALKKVIIERFWDESEGYFRDALETSSFGFEANALALSTAFVTPEQALRIAPLLKRVDHGKFQSLASRGKFEYGFGQSALQAIFDHNWTKLLDAGWQGAATTTECMGMNTGGWGDESHPDTAIAALFSGYVLGVCPTEPGYRRFLVRPQPAKEVRWAKGLVPTPHGPIEADWELAGKTLKLNLTVPQGTVADVAMPKNAGLLVNGKTGDARNLPAGRYVIEAVDLAADALIDPTLAVKTKMGNQQRSISLNASSSHEEGGWGLSSLFASEQDKTKKGYSSAARTSTEATEWIEIDLGEVTSVAKLVLLPRTDTKSIDNKIAGFPRDFMLQVAKEPGEFTTIKTFAACSVPDDNGLTLDLYSAIGYPAARYIRLTATRLGEPARDEPGNYRLQFSRLRVVLPD